MSKEYDQHVVIKTLDNPIRILFWDLPDFATLILPFFLGMFLESGWILLGGVLLRWGGKRLLRGLPKGHLKRMAYWHLPTRALNRALKTNLPPSHIRKFIH